MNLWRFAFRVVLLTVTTDLVAAPAAQESTQALTNWLVAVSGFRKAGAFIGQQKFSEAKAELSSGKTNLAAPYKSLAAEYLSQLDSVRRLSTNQADPRRIQALIGLCTDLRAYEAALKLQTADPKVTADELSDDALYAWRLFNSGDGKAALGEYARRSEREPVEYFQDYYKEQVRLLQQRPAAMTNVELALETTRQHYLKGLEANRDSFGALTELTRVLPYVKNAKEAIPVYQLIFKCLETLGDESGRTAWQDKFLADYKSEPEVCAIVYVDRGQKALLRKDMNESEAAFRKVCTDYAKTSLYADALFGLGLVLQEEQKYDAAIAEFTRIFSSNANEDLLDPESSEDYPNYKNKAARRLSECYEATKDLKKALQYALMARDQYPYVSYCKDCMFKTRQLIENRVKDLETAVKRAAPVAAP
jgi:hypothetical protein